MRVARDIHFLRIGFCMLMGLSVAGAIGAASVSCGGAAAPAESTTSTSTTLDEGLDYRFTFARDIPKAASLYSTYLAPWVSDVEKASSGRVVIEIGEPGGFQKQDGTVLSELLEGRADLAVLAASWAPGEYPLLELAELPMLFPDTETAARVTLQLIQEYGQEEFEGLHVLGFMTSGLSQYGGIEPVRTPADLQGLRIRTGSDLENEMTDALDAAPRDYRWIAPLETKFVDFQGLFLPWVFHAGNTNDWATYWTTCDLYVYRPMLLVMNQERWDSLPAAVQQAFTDNSGAEASVKYLADDAKYNYDNSLMPELGDRGWDYRAIEERARELGHPIYVLSEAEQGEWREALLPVWDKWVLKYASVLPATFVLDRALELVQEYSVE